MKKKKILKTVICCLCGAFVGAMLYFHRRVIVAMIKGEELPKAPKGCPARAIDEVGPSGPAFCFCPTL